jgi:flagellar biosynthesis/type III secretory pathway M-ring protein FliF/YscJ
LKSRKNFSTQPNQKLRPDRDETSVNRVEIDFLRQKILERVQKAPEKAAVILKDWLDGKSDAARTPPKKKVA